MLVPSDIITMVMNKLIPLLVALLALAGCASVIESPTAIPVNSSVPQATAAGVNPQAQSAGTPAPSGCQSRISGRVTDGSGALIKGAAVTLSGGALRTPSQTVTDDNGLYGFAGLCGGSYSFAVTLPGQAAKKLSTTATVDGTGPAKADLVVK